jgi:isoleucyl-tRNA synthetase
LCEGFIIFIDTTNTMQDNNQKPLSVSEKEEKALRFWEENHIFEKSIEQPGGGEPQGTFSFYDGPPFATGLPHHGSLMAGTVKDLIPRYQTMRGNSVRRVWGWDCHGLPIENLIEKKLGLASKKDIEAFGIDKFNADAYASVLQYEEEWKKIIPRLGRWADMSHPYKTMDATYTESIWFAWKSLYEKKLAYEGSKMMHICPRCETPLAQSEVGLEYTDVTDLSVTAEFELEEEKGTYVLAWTTTPWTLPGNTALALHKDIVYVKVKSTQEGITKCYILAKSKVEEYFKDNESKEIVGEFPGSTLVGKKYLPLFPYFKDKELEHKENIWKIWHADFITEDAGTGIAHEAPAFGDEDMQLAKEHNIPVIKHVKMDGTFTDDVEDFKGLKVKKAGDTQSTDVEIIKWLAHNGKLFEKHKIVHSYPLCWRCKTPLLNYATSSWFVDVPKMKEKLLKENSAIGWTPEHIRDGRFGKWLEGAREWAVSRSRYWGAPLPVWKNHDGSKVHVVGSLKELASCATKKPKNTYFAMRHGESVFNVLDRLDSLGDETNTLTEKGIEQAVLAGNKIQELGVDVIITSPLLRTRETSAIIAKGTQATIVVDERLREFHFGEYESMNATTFRSIRSIHEHLNERVPGGESFRDGAHRFMQVVASCEEKYEGKKILFVTHGSMVYMGIHEAELATSEEIIANKHKEEGLNVHNGQVISFVPASVPRDATGAINLHRPYIDGVELIVGGEVYTRISDVFDCWFESGSMPFASIHYPFENKDLFKEAYPATFIAESMDQTRGWFYSLINLGVGLFDIAPYKHVICNGLINASDGKKLSKSLNNYTDPMLLVERFGADAFRLYLMSSPVVKGESINFSDKELDEVYKRCIMRFDNVVALYKMGNVQVQAGTSSSNPLDRWMISRVHELVKEATDGYDAYKLDEATKGIDQIVDDLSIWYTRRSRDRLKGLTGEEDEYEAYSTLRYVLLTLAKTVAPVLPFLAERTYQELRGDYASVHLEKWPEQGFIDKELIASMKEVRELVSLGLMKRTEHKLSVKQPLSSVTFNKEVDPELIFLIEEELNVKEVFYDKNQKEDVVLDVTITEALKREGDIRKIQRGLQELRKEHNLSSSETVNSIALSIELSDEEIYDLKKVVRAEEIIYDKDCKGKVIELSSSSVFASLTLGHGD